MTQVTRKITFDAGHRLINHEGKCRHLHGHTYVAEITCEAQELDDVGRVIDFGVIKERVGGWIDAYWDHNVLLHKDDALVNFMDNNQPDKLVFTMSCNPTAENMARILFRMCRSLLNGHPIEVVSVRLWETPNCCALYKPE